MVKPNVAGWAAVFAPGVVLGGTVGVLMRKPIGWCALVGSGTSWTCTLSSTLSGGERMRSASCSPKDFSDDDRAQLLAAFEAEKVDASIRTETNPVTRELY